MNSIASAGSGRVVFSIAFLGISVVIEAYSAFSFYLALLFFCGIFNDFLKSFRLIFELENSQLYVMFGPAKSVSKYIFDGHSHTMSSFSSI